MKRHLPFTPLMRNPLSIKFVFYSTYSQQTLVNYIVISEEPETVPLTLKIPKSFVCLSIWNDFFSGIPGRCLAVIVISFIRQSANMGKIFRFVASILVTYFACDSKQHPHIKDCLWYVVPVFCYRLHCNVYCHYFQIALFSRGRSMSP